MISIPITVFITWICLSVVAIVNLILLGATCIKLVKRYKKNDSK